MCAGLILASVAMLLAAAFCAGTETCFLSVSRERVLHLSQAGGKKAKIVQQALTDLSRTLTTLLIGNNLASVAYSTATAALIADLCSDSAWRTVWSFAAAFVVLYVSEFMPKLLCAARPLRRSLYIARPYAVMAAVLAPLTEIAVRLTNLFIRNRRDDRYRLTAADLVRILQDRKDGVCLSDIESALIGRIMVLRARGRPITADALLTVLRM